MDFGSKKSSLVVLGITAAILSRMLFVFLEDPEGPNLLVVAGTAAFVYLVSLASFFSLPTTAFAGAKRLLPLIAIQVLIIAGLYLLLR